MPRVQHHADDHLAARPQADRDAVKRKVVGVVGGAVERIDDPGRRSIGRRPHLGTALLLAEEAVLRKALGEIGADGLLRADVGVGDEVEASLFLDLEAAAPVLEHGGAAPGSLTGGVEVIRQCVGGHDRRFQRRRDRSSRRELE